MSGVEVTGVPRMVAGLIEDVRAIARGMEVLPELARSLTTIEARVDALSDEVRRMREAVEEMGGDVNTLPRRIDDLQHSLSPLRRIGRRLGRTDSAES